MKKITFTLIALVATLCAMAQAKFWVYNNDGTQTEYLISDVDSISFTEPTPTDKVTDACGITYPVVKIGEQYWMAENMRCNKYGTQSEAYKEGRYTVPTSNSRSFSPYYTDASDRSKWHTTEYAGNLSDSQVQILGYSYNWAAAVGFADGREPIPDYTGNCQGICPNGWHVPSKTDWQTLYDYIYSVQKLTSNSVGKYLKSTSGWYGGGNGLDTYGFAALPAGDAEGNSFKGVGAITYFWTYYSNGSPHIRSLFYTDGYMYGESNADGDVGHSVRCLRD